MTKPVLRIDSRGWWWRGWIHPAHGPFPTALDAYNDYHSCLRVSWVSVSDLRNFPPPSDPRPIRTH